ncbi:CG34201, partial [Drosophila busckii]
STAPKPNQLVPVYPISSAQYAQIMRVANGKRVLTEGRLTAANFKSIRNNIDSGWQSMLRIMGLSRDSSEKIDIEGKPLCVTKSGRDAANADEDV